MVFLKHAINAIGLLRGWRHGTYGQKHDIVTRLDAEGHSNLLELLSAARRLHTDSDNGVLTAPEVAAFRRDAAALAEQLLAIAAAP